MYVKQHRYKLRNSIFLFSVLDVNLAHAENKAYEWSVGDDMKGTGRARFEGRLLLSPHSSLLT